MYNVKKLKGCPYACQKPQEKSVKFSQNERRRRKKFGKHNLKNLKGDPYICQKPKEKSVKFTKNEKIFF